MRAALEGRAGPAGHPGAHPCPGSRPRDTQVGGGLRAVPGRPVTGPLSWAEGKGTTTDRGRRGAPEPSQPRPPSPALGHLPSSTLASLHWTPPLPRFPPQGPAKGGEHKNAPLGRGDLLGAGVGAERGRGPVFRPSLDYLRQSVRPWPKVGAGGGVWCHSVAVTFRATVPQCSQGVCWPCPVPSDFRAFYPKPLTSSRKTEKYN